MKKRMRHSVLAILAGLLLGCSFPPSPLYSLAYVAFIPVFFIFDECDSVWKFAFRLYLFLFTFHLVTIYWTGGYASCNDIWMMIAGAAVILFHPIFFIPLLLVAFYIKRRLGALAGYWSFALFWVSFEYLHSLTEYSFPWLTIANSQAYNVIGVQCIEYCSVYGFSFYIISFNILAYILIKKLSKQKNNIVSKKSILAIAVLLVLYFAPRLYGLIKIHQYETDHGKKLHVAVVQPNIDPWEKWGDQTADPWVSYNQQFNLLLSESRKLSIDSPDVYIWPETAIPFHVLLPRYRSYQQELFSFIDSVRTPIITGLPAVDYFDALHAPATSQKITDDLFAQSYNSVVVLKPGNQISPVYKKIELVPFGERLPYPETFKFLIEPLKWNVGISSWGKGSDTLALSFTTRTQTPVVFGPVICYESAYPDFVRAFVLRGAQFLTVVTNDSWWGNTSGAYQHVAFASLRAIETRRWIVQCANGGISALIDPTGTVRFKTKLYTNNSFTADIHLNTETTFYVRYGDIVGKLCVLLSLIIAIYAFTFDKMYQRKM